MDFSIILFLIFGFASLLGAFKLDGGNIGALIGLTPAMIVFGGTIAAVGIAFPLNEVKRIPKIFKILLQPKKINIIDQIIFFRDISFKTRKNGLLSIESDIYSLESDPLIKKGLQMVVDGVEPTIIQGVLEMQVEMTAERHKKGAEMFEAAGGFAPTMGIIGTVMGLVHGLSNLAEPASLGAKIAVAFIATLYGVASANIMWLPIASRLKALEEEEFNEKRLIIEAILLIQSGTNPNTLVEKLKGFLTQNEILKFEADEKGMD